MKRWRSRCILWPCESAPSSILHPPSFSDEGKLRTCKKSDWVKCLDPTARGSDKPEDFDCKIFDGAALVPISKPDAVDASQEYGESVYVKFLQRELQSLDIVDVVWDRYLASGIKGSAK